MTEKERYLRTGDAALFRLSFLCDPHFVWQRLKAVRSWREGRRRVQDVLRLLRWRLQDRVFDLRLRAAPAGSTKRVKPAPLPPCPSESLPRPHVHLSWNIHIACNYDCPYCWFHGHWHEFGKAANLVLAPDAWQRHWERFNARCGPAHIDIAGGEPFTYPGFLDILERVCKNNTCDVTTNLSLPVEPFLARMDPARVALSASFHPESAGDPQAFIEKLLRLRQAGFRAEAFVVAWPPTLLRMQELVGRFREHGIALNVQPFRGEWRGRAYPRGYTAAARALLERLIQGGLQDQPATEDAQRVLTYQLAEKPTSGRLCNAGVLYGRIQANGDVTRCAQGGRLIGSFLSEDFRLCEKAEPCPFPNCPCINEMSYIL